MWFVEYAGQSFFRLEKAPVSYYNLGNKCGIQVESSDQVDTVGRFPFSGLWTFFLCHWTYNLGLLLTTLQGSQRIRLSVSSVYRLTRLFLLISMLRYTGCLVGAVNVLESSLSKDICLYVSHRCLC